MSRKEESKEKTATVSVNIDDFTRTRDNVIVSLAALQSAVSDVSRAYINHANTVLNRAPSSLDLGTVTTNLLENGLLGGHRAHTPTARSDPDDSKKKRKRAPPDPNAPKRALTPYFLYMQHNRSKIAQELGTSAKPKEVADEGTRRWATMGKEERQVWQDLYAENLAVYKAKMEAYKAGLPIPDLDEKDPSDQLLQGVHGGSPGSNAQEGSEDEDEDEEEEEEEETPEPEKEPTPPPPRSAKRRRTGDHKPVSTPPTTKRSSPEKKKKSAAASKAEREAPSTAEKPKRGAAEDKNDKKRSKKKRRSEAAGSD